MRSVSERSSAALVSTSRSVQCAPISECRYPRVSPARVARKPIQKAGSAVPTADMTSFASVRRRRDAVSCRRRCRNSNSGPGNRASRMSATHRRLSDLRASAAIGHNRGAAAAGAADVRNRRSRGVTHRRSRRSPTRRKSNRNNSNSVCRNRRSCRGADRSAGGAGAAATGSAVRLPVRRIARNSNSRSNSNSRGLRGLRNRHVPRASRLLVRGAAHAANAAFADAVPVEVVAVAVRTRRRRNRSSRDRDPNLLRPAGSRSQAPKT